MEVTLVISHPLVSSRLITPIRDKLSNVALIATLAIAYIIIIIVMFASQTQVSAKTYNLASEINFQFVYFYSRLPGHPY